MGVFESMSKNDHEQVIFCRDESAGLRSIIAIHDTTLGPALGGTRMWTYKSEEECLLDVLRLSRGMTHKAAIAGLNLGGGKAVIVGDPKTDKTEALFRAHGRFVESLGGRYITAEDVGTTVQDMEYVSMETRHVTGVEVSKGGGGDPSPVTAYGVFMGMKACAKELFGSDSLDGRTIAVQGVGQTGYYLAEHLHKAGARLIVTDIDAEKVSRVVKEFDSKSVPPDEIYEADAEIFAPCALGSVVNEDTIGHFKFKVIAGSANNQLATRKYGDRLEKMGILYAPDYVINAGGLINVSIELEGYNRERALRKAANIYEAILNIFAIAKKEKIPTYKAADRLALQRIEAIGKVKRKFIA